MAPNVKRLESLQRVTGIARAQRVLLVNVAKRAGAETMSNQLHFTLDPASYRLPLIPSVLSELASLGLGHDDAINVAQHYSQYAAKVKAIFESSMHTVMRAWVQNNHGGDLHEELAAVHSRYSWQYTMLLRYNRDATIAAVYRHLRRQPPAAPSEEPRRSSFGQNALSLLESAFEEEAYPSREVKDQLAVRTGMERRQIDVWFQNKRNRSKKQQRELRSARHFHKRDGSIIVFSPHCRISDTPSSPVSEDDEKVSLTPPAQREVACIFASQTPSHAFPTPYPPSEPLSTSNLQTPWPRRLATEAKEGSVSSVEVDQLCEAFSRLTTIDTAETQIRHSVVPVRRSTGSCSTTCYGFNVVPPQAPLPALQLETATGTSSRAHRITRSSIGGDAASCPSSQACSPSTPRRTRKRSPFARDGAHPYPPSSRHSSTSSRSSSGSSIYSLPTPSDSPLSSPTHKPIDLPSEDV